MIPMRACAMRNAAQSKCRVMELGALIDALLRLAITMRSLFALRFERIQ
jgi:hypothetical protein